MDETQTNDTDSRNTREWENISDNKRESSKDNIIINIRTEGREKVLQIRK